MEQVNAKISDMLPEDWFKKQDESSFFLASYKILLVPNKIFNKNIMFIDLPGMRAFIIYGSVSYLDRGEFSIEFNQNHQAIINVNPEFRSTKVCGHLLLAHPFQIDGLNGDESVVRKRVSAYAGLFASFFGRNCVFELEFENIVHCAGDKVEVCSPVFENPYFFGVPDLSIKNVEYFKLVVSHLSGLNQEVRNRIELAFHWFEASLRNIDGIDTFIKLWVAIEVLAMPDTTNIRPANELLAASYGLSVQEASDRFMLGRLFGLRSRIIHNGEKIPMHQEILRLMEALFIDLLLATLGLDGVGKSEIVVRQQGEVIDLAIRAG